MTTPPPLPNAHVSAAPVRPARRVFVWLCIGLSLALHIVLGLAGGPAQEAATTHALAALEMTITGRYLVGAHAILGSYLDQDLPRAMQALDLRAREDPTNSLRAIMLTGELTGTAAALEKLDRQQAGPLAVPDVRRDVQTLTQIYRAGAASLDAAGRARLLQRYPWFGQLALSHGLPATNPERAAALAPAIRAFFSLFIMGLLMCFAGGSGLVLLIVASVLLARGKLRRQYQPPPPGSTVFLEAFALYLGAASLLSLLTFLLRRSGWHLPPAANLLILLVIPLPLVWPRFRGLSWHDTARTLGLYAPRGIGREIAAGLVGYIAGLPIMACGLGLTLILTTVTGNKPSHPIALEAQGGIWLLIEMFLLAVVWAPITEELMFRGAFFGHLRQRWGWAISASLVAFIFAALHPQGWVAIPILGAIALVLAGIREWRGSIFGSMAAHALNNTIAVALLVLLAS